MVSKHSKALVAAAAAIIGLTAVSGNVMAQTVSDTTPATVTVIDAITLTGAGSIDFGTISAVSSDDGTADVATFVVNADGTGGTVTNGTNASITTTGSPGGVPTFTVASAAGVAITIGAPTGNVNMACTAGPSCDPAQIFTVSTFTAVGTGPTTLAGTGAAVGVVANGATFTTGAADDTFTVGGTLSTGSGLDLDANAGTTTAAYQANTYDTTTAGTDVQIDISF